MTHRSWLDPRRWSRGDVWRPVEMLTDDICVLEILGCPQECRRVVGSPVELECPDNVRLVDGKRVDVRQVMRVGGDRRLHDPVPHCFSAGSLARFGSVGDEHGVSGHGKGLSGGPNGSDMASYVGEPGPQSVGSNRYLHHGHLRQPLLNGTYALVEVLGSVRRAAVLADAIVTAGYR